MMTSQKAYSILHLSPGANLEQVKQAYRKLAFTLHPDLNPHLKEAQKSFQRLNEAYVFLLKLHERSSTTQSAGYGNKKASNSSTSQGRSQNDDRKAYEEAKKAYDEAQKAYGSQTYAKSNRQGNGQNAEAGEQSQSRRREDVLNDILNDPFAKRVFEDIYRHIQEEHRGAKTKKNNAKNPEKADADKTNYSFCHKRDKVGREQKGRRGILGRIKGWLRRQIDDEQVLVLPAASVVPGARLRLDIQHGIGSEVRTIEITLPQDFTLDKKVRLQGLGKRLGSIRGDLYVCISPE